MARARSRGQRHRDGHLRTSVWRGGLRGNDGVEIALHSVETIYEHAIEAQVCDKKKPIVTGNSNKMSVGAFLAFFVGAERTGVLLHARGLAQFAVSPQRKNGNGPGSVVGSKKVLAGLVESEVAGIFAACGNLIQESEPRGLRIEGECADGARLA